ncbi:hypothetical protein TheetDRAFT_2955, partial [Thermoanaerobacter ethanolicus JW 200]
MSNKNNRLIRIVKVGVLSEKTKEDIVFCLYCIY